MTNQNKDCDTTVLQQLKEDIAEMSTQLREKLKDDNYHLHAGYQLTIQTNNLILDHIKFLEEIKK